jgi:hypothetical protein
MLNMPMIISNVWVQLLGFSCAMCWNCSNILAHIVVTIFMDPPHLQTTEQNDNTSEMIKDKQSPT